MPKDSQKKILKFEDFLTANVIVNLEKRVVSPILLAFVVLSLAAANSTFGFLRNTRHRIAAETALRDGEILGLAQEFMVPDGKRIIQVRYQWRCRKDDYNNGIPVLQRPKTPQSVRDVKISSALAAELITWKQAHAKNPFVHTWDGEQVQLMFVSEANRPCTRNNLRKAMIRAIKHAHESDTKLRSLDFYSLRHHRASIWIEEGLKKGLMSDLEIAAMMGHKNSTITREVYATYLKSESTFDPDDLEKPVAVKQPEASRSRSFYSDNS